VAESKKAGIVGGIGCELCQLVVKFAKDELANNNTEVTAMILHVYMDAVHVHVPSCSYTGTHVHIF